MLQPEGFCFSRLLSENLPFEFLSDVVAGFPRIYQETYVQAFSMYQPQTAKNQLPFMRWGRVDDFLRELAETYNLVSAYRPNAAKNCSHAEIGAGPVVLTASKVNSPDEMVRRAVFRETLAETTQGLLPIPGLQSRRVLYGKCYAIFLHGPDQDDAEQLGFIHLAVPDHTCKSYLLNINLRIMVAETMAQREQVEEITDQAIPTLKQRKKAESE